MAKRDYYEVLGVARTATADDIRKAYRKLARQYHPDVNKSPDAAKKFTEVQEAYDVLSDDSRRRTYDEVGHAPEPRAGAGAGGGHYPWTNAAGHGAEVDTEDLSSMFDAFFGGRGQDFGMGGMGGRARTKRGRARAQPEPQPPPEHELEVTFLTAVRGGNERLRLSADGKVRTIDVTIPQGVTNGARLRVRGGSGAGDLILRIKVGEHPLFRRTEVRGVGAEGLDLYLDLPLSIAEATLGATVAVPTLNGTIELTVPPGSASGRKLRLRGRGVEDAKGAKGDLYAILKIVPPEGGRLSADDAAALRRIAGTSSPRTGPEWPTGAA
jgi:curved DNA-binding protein